MHFFGFRVGTWQSVVISCLVDTKYLSEERKGLVASILRSSKWDQAMFSILHRKKLDVFVLNQLERLCPEVTVHDSFYLERDIAGKVSEVYSWELDDLFNRLAGLESGAFLIKGEDVVRRILSGENIGISTDIDMLVSPRDRSGNTLASVLKDMGYVQGKLDPRCHRIIPRDPIDVAKFEERTGRLSSLQKSVAIKLSNMEVQHIYKYYNKHPLWVGESGPLLCIWFDISLKLGDDLDDRI